MSYIGRGTESISNVEVLDNLTFNGSASYTLQKSSVNFVPSSANNLLISISGVVQQGNFSVSGSTITFDTTVSGSDTCDWILHYGTGLITTVADGAITEAKLGSNAVTTAKINNGAITSAKLDSGLALGKIGQVVQSTSNTYIDTNSSTFIDTGLSTSITPTSTSSKILVTVHLNGVGKQNNNTRAEFKLLRGATDIVGINSIVGSTGDTSENYVGTVSTTYLDSPSSTSSTSYKIQFRSTDNLMRAVLQNYATTVGSSVSTITLMEVLA